MTSRSTQEWLNSLDLKGSQSQNDLLSGNTVHLILQKAISEYNNQLQTPLSTAVNKMTNWNSIINFLESFARIKITAEQRNSIIQGDQQLVNRIIAKIKSFVENSYAKLENQVDINKLDQRADPKHAKSLLELFILILVKNLGLTAKQSVALLSNDCKYLAHILAKGFKEQSQHVLSMLSDLQDLLPQINEFCMNQQNEIFFLKSIKPGLISRFKEIGWASLRILQKFSLLRPNSFQIFRIHLISTMILQYRRHPQSLQAICLAIIKLSNKYTKTLLSVLFQNLQQKELLQFYHKLLELTLESSQSAKATFFAMNKTDDLLNLCVQSLSDTNTFMVGLWILLRVLQCNYQLVAGSGVEAEIENTPKKVSAKGATGNSRILSKVVHNLQNLPSVFKPIHVQAYVNGLFSLLEILGNKRNAIAPVIFKLCVQKFRITLSHEQAQIYGHNFLNILQLFPHIPSTLIVDVIAERYENFKTLLTTVDIMLLGKIVTGQYQSDDDQQNEVSQGQTNNKISSKSSKLKEGKSRGLKKKLSLAAAKSTRSQKTQQNGQIKPIDEKTLLKIYNVLSKVFLEQVSSSQYVADILIQIVLSNSLLQINNRQQEQQQAIQQLNTKMFKVCLAVHFANIKKLSSSSSSSSTVVYIDQNNAFTKRKNLDIQYFLTRVILLEDKQFNQYIQPLVCYSYIQSSANHKMQSQGIGQILALLGDVGELVSKYEKQIQLLHQQKQDSSINTSTPNKKKQHSQSKYQNSDSIFNPSSPGYNNLSREQQKQIEQSEQYYSNLMPIPATQERLKPGDDYSLYLSKFSKVPLDSQKGIEKYKKMHKDKLSKEKLQEQRLMQEQLHRENLQKIYTKKILEKGIKINPAASKNYKHLYQFNQKQAELERQTQYDLSFLHLFNHDEEQDSDLQALMYLMKRNNKILKLYYNTYGGNFRTKSGAYYFDEIVEQSQLMNLASLWKLFKDHFLDQFITFKQAQYLLQHINAKKKTNHKDIHLLDFETFYDFLIQASLTMFSRPPKDLSGYSISFMVEEMFYQFKLHAADNKFDPRLFDDEKQREAMAEADPQLLELNLKLRENNNYILPEGYKKITQKKVQFYHSICLNSLGESYSDVVDVLDEILNQAFGFNIIQPYSVVVTNVFANPKMYKRKQQTSQDAMEKYFSLSVKKALSNFSPADRLIARDVAYTLMQVVDAVDIGQQMLGSRNNKQTKIKQMEMQRQEQQQKRINQEKRNQMIKKQLQKKKELSQEKSKEYKQKKIQEKKKSEEERKKKEKYDEQLKKKLEDYQRKKEEEKKVEEELEKKKKLKGQSDFEKRRAQLQQEKKKIQQIREQKKLEEQRLRKEEQDKRKAKLTLDKQKVINRSLVMTPKKNIKNKDQRQSDLKNSRANSKKKLTAVDKSKQSSPKE